MRTAKLLALATITIPTSFTLVGCVSDTLSQADRHTHMALSTGTVGGGGDFGGGAGSWGGGGSMFAGGGGFFAGSGGFWSGGSGVWGGGAGQWSGGGDLFSGGGYWAGGSGNWNGGGNNWGGGGNWWGGGGSNFAGGGANFAGGGSNFAGGNGLWAGGAGLWSGGFAAAFPFVGWSGARQWQYRGVPQPATLNGGVQYQAAVPSTWPVFSGTGDTTACASGNVRLGGFNVNFDADGWPGFLALGYTKGLCIPTPGGQGLRVQATAGDGSMMGIGGYVMNGDAPTATTSNAQRDAYMLTSLVGAGTSNVATQYGGALCASIGSLAAARRSCAMGIAMAGPNAARDGVSLTPRGITVKGTASPATGAQIGTGTFNTPFGRPDGHGIYGETAGDMESYANRVMQEHTSLAIPASASSIDAWNDANFSAAQSFGGGDFAPRTLSASPSTTTGGASASAADLLANINRSLAAPLNMVPIDPIPTSPTDALNIERKADMSNGVAVRNGKVYALNLHSLAEQENPLYGSGGGRWFFHSPADSTKPLLDLSAIYQAPTRFLTGQLTVSSWSLSSSYITDADTIYADWNGNPAGTFGIDHAGQWPTTVSSDADREARLRAAFVLPTGMSNLVSGQLHSCAILSVGGAVKCWGSNTYGVLGNTTVDPVSVTPIQVSGLTSGVQALSAGSLNTCALLSNGAVQCWGYRGTLGNGTTVDSTYPVQVSGLTSGVQSIASQGGTTCAVLADGTGRCWGNGTSGQQGDGTTTAALTPVQPTGLGQVSSFGVGGYHTCAVLMSGAVSCWGSNSYGQLGNGTTTDSLTPVAVSGITNARAVVAGQWHTCALLASGKVTCWGYQWGNGTNPPASKTSPTIVGGVSGAAAIAAGYTHTCALLNSGATMCWGTNDSGQLGTGTTTASSSPVASSLGTATSIAAGWYGSTCVRLTTGSIQCVGNNAFGQLGVPQYVSAPQATPVTSGATVTSNASSYGCAVISGAAKCWGNNYYGYRFGGGAAANVVSTSPVQVSGLTSGASQIATGKYNACAVLSSGALMCWGQGANGIVGNGLTTDSINPVQIASGATAAAVGASSACAVIGGAAKCWGNNSNGTIGDGTTNNSTVPVQVSGLTSNVTSVSVGPYHACAIVGGAVKCWGAGTFGQLGDGTHANSLVPLQVSGLTSGVAAIAVGDYMTCALQSGAVYCWGSNTWGIGNGTTTGSNTPVQVIASGATAISARAGQMCAVVSGGAKCWGSDSYGQQGDANAGGGNLSPTGVSGLTSGVSTIAVGDVHTCAVLTSGAIKCWGEDDGGELMSGGGYRGLDLTPVAASNGLTNGALVTSQASVFVQAATASAGSIIGGHVRPIVYTMANNTTGNTALIVAYDPLAVAAAMFIEQYNAHISACKATKSESMTELDQQAGSKLWACSNSTSSSAYLSGMQALLNGARSYLFGRTDGSASTKCQGAGGSAPPYCIDATNAHFPYTFVVPGYTSSAYNGDPTVTSGTGAYYYSQLDTALSSYRDATLKATGTSELHRTLQLAGITSFSASTSALVTTRIKRSGAFGTACVKP